MRRRAVLVTLLPLAMWLAVGADRVEGRPQKCNAGHPCPTPTPTKAPMTGWTGLNIYNANSRWNCWYPLGFNDGALADTLTASGVRTFRAWFFQRLATTNGARDWAAFDHTFAVARSMGVKVVVTLMDTGGTCDSGQWHYADWFASGYRSPFGTDLRSYRDYVSEIVTRYRSEASILAWQIGNELETKNPDGTCGSASSMDAFAADIAGLIKSIDSSHLVSVGTIGSGQCGAQGSAEYRALHASPNVDLCEYHDYSDPSNPMPGDQWNGLQTRLTDCAAVGKRLFVGEVGIAASDPNRASEFAAKIDAQFGAGVVGFLPWEWRAAGQGGGDQYAIGPGDPTLAVLH